MWLFLHLWWLWFANLLQGVVKRRDRPGLLLAPHRAQRQLWR